MMLLRPAQAAKKLGIAPATLWNWVKKNPEFPRPIKIGPQATAFVEAELDEFILKQRQRQARRG